MSMTLLFFAAAYFLGSVNFSIILFKTLKKDDPRQMYSGNAGTTNVFRQAGPVWAAIVLLLDAGRAVLAAYLAILMLLPEHVPWVSFFLILGNRFPFFHGFRGGKGVANYLGFTAVVSPLAAAVSCAVWVFVFAIERIPFIASFAMVATLMAGTAAEYFEFPAAVAGALVTALFICLNHWSNVTDFLKRKKMHERDNSRDSE